MIKAVIFDLDNTLVDFIAMKHAAIRAAAVAMVDAGLKIPEDKAEKKIYEIYDEEGIEDQKVFDKFLKKELGQIDYRIHAAGIIGYRRAREAALVLYPHVQMALMELVKRGLKLAVVTDAPRLQAWLRLCQLNLHHFFDVVITYEDTNKRKPDPEPFEKALEIGRPPNVKKLFPNSKALIVSGKFIDRTMLKKGKAISMAANGRNSFVISGALQAAQRANSAIIIEIAKSEGGADAYCAVNYWNIARIVDAFCNELGITIPVAIHADHYGIKSQDDVESAKIEIPSIFDAGITSIAIDASHMPDDKNLLANIELNPFIPNWAGYETEIGEIKGKEGLSTVDEALFLIQGLNAHDIFPDWIALNNGTTHGIEASAQGIQVDLTEKIHNALTKYAVSGAQHGTSGNSSERLREIAARTRTTKANVATALQMISWGLEVNDYGNAELFPSRKNALDPGESLGWRVFLGNRLTV